MIQLPQLHESLLIANERLVDRARRRARLFRTGLISSAAVLSIGGAATAGLALWNPILGHEDGNRPSISSSPVPVSQSATLGVLRREQTAADRGLMAQEALAAATRRYVGVRLSGVRVIVGDGAGTGLALVPVDRLRPRSTAGPTVTDDALCVFGRTAATDFELRCFSTTDVREGRATGSVGARSWGLVPDGVAQISVPSAGSEPQVLPVRDNAFTAATSTIDPRDRSVTWLDDRGRTITPAGGTAMNLPVRSAVRTTVPDGFHDCGSDRGDVVPDAIACGPEAERYVPPATGAPSVARP